MEYLQGLPAFAGYFGMGIGFVALFLVGFLHFTPHRELRLIRDGNLAASTALAGAMVGFCLPLAAAISHSVSYLDLGLWGLVALVAQFAAHVLTRLLLPAFPARIEEDSYPQPYSLLRCIWAWGCSTLRPWRTDMRARKPRRNFGDVVHKAEGRERKRSFEVPLLWLGAAVFIGYPMLRDATADDMLRNVYGRDRQSCECDYGEDGCSLRTGSWVGPWYAAEAGARRADDPGGGACRSRTGGYYTGYAGSNRPDDTYRGPASVEPGYRGGFGGTGRVRAAGS